MKPSSWMPYSLFQSTPSARRATRDPDKDPPKVETISIHALREESDKSLPPRKPT